MSLDQMKVFNEYFMPATIETLAQMIDKFNAASNNTIRLTAEGFDGDFMQESFFQALGAARRRVDRYAANAAVAPVDLEELQKDGVKVAGGFGPVRYEPSQMGWLNRPSVQGIETASREFASYMLQDELNTAIASVTAAIENNAATTNDVSATGPVSYAAMNQAHAAFGDRSGMLAASVMDGATMHKLIGQNLTNAERLFQADGVRVVDILGRAVVVTDAPALYEAGAPNKSKILSLCEGAVTIYDPSDVITNIDTSNGNQRIETTFQSDYSFGVALKGYSWDVANGGKSPDDAELATGSNWDKVVADDKHTAGVLTIGDAAG